ncbi:TetR/AcrR family transcriptional regulator [Hyphomonas sp. CACIAM 19H1]|uniref:TetR/AcrR family transcriptional regulator n=1 Tax=Hyphomonas sp. CACIAM 19H1 TaxID=1873716 RepID=UPI00351A8FC5
MRRNTLTARSKTPPPKADRRTAILDAAEAEFSAHGFDGVTLRTIAKRAGVDLALPNYYFGPKKQLFDAVFIRRAQIVNLWREEALKAAIEAARPQPPTVEAIIRAYLEPMLTGPHLEDQGWKNYYALVAYVNNSPGWGGRLMAEHFDPLIRQFLDALRLSLPGMDEKDLYWGYQCFSGALTLALAQTGRIDHLSGGVCRSDDLADACEHMVHFIAGGFEAPRRAAPAALTPPAPKRRAAKRG